MDTDYLEPVYYGSVGSIALYERMPDEDREVKNNPIGFIHFKDTEE